MSIEYAQSSDVATGHHRVLNTVAHGDDTLDDVITPSDPQVQTYARRWYILFLFASIGLWQGVVWNTWGPISDSASLVFGWTDADIAMFANIGNIMYCLVVFFSSWIMDVLGLRIATLLCSGMVFAGAGLRCITSEATALYWLSSLAAMLNGSAGTVTFAAPALFSSIWFPPTQRATATAIITMFNYVGVSGSLLIGPQIVHFINPFHNISHHEAPISFSDDGTNITTLNPLANLTTMMPMTTTFANHTDVIAKQRDQMMELMYIEAGVAALLFLLVIVYFPSKPPHPPSISASLDRLDFKEGIVTLSKQSKFWLVALSYSIPSGVLGMWCSVLNINLHPVGITQDEAGWLGFYYISAGAVTGLIVCMFSDHFSRHIKTLLLILYACAGGALLWVLLLCEFYIRFSKVELYVSAIFAGIFINASIPLFYEMASELCYPVAEGIIGGYLTFMNNFVGVVLLSSFYIPHLGKAWLNWVMFVSTVAVIPLLFLVPESYGRLRLDSAVNIRTDIGHINDGDQSDDDDDTARLVHSEYQPVV